LSRLLRHSGALAEAQQTADRHACAAGDRTAGRRPASSRSARARGRPGASSVRPCPRQPRPRLPRRRPDVPRPAYWRWPLSSRRPSSAVVGAAAVPVTAPTTASVV
jgi:hypothetical protein